VRRQARIHVEQVLGIRLVSIGLNETLNLISPSPIVEGSIRA